MPSTSIHFFSEEISFNIPHKSALRRWIKETIKSENFKLGELNFIFCSDNYLLNINRQYLKHNTLTDIITFDNSDRSDSIFGDVFISVERVRENASTFNVTEKDELHRVMIHGTLHLLGYPDKDKTAKAIMTSKENYYLSKRSI